MNFIRCAVKKKHILEARFDTLDRNFDFRARRCTHVPPIAVQVSEFLRHRAQAMYVIFE